MKMPLQSRAYEYHYQRMGSADSATEEGDEEGKYDGDSLDIIPSTSPIKGSV